MATQLFLNLLCRPEVSLVLASQTHYDKARLGQLSAVLIAVSVLFLSHGPAIDTLPPGNVFLMTEKYTANSNIFY